MRMISNLTNKRIIFQSFCKNDNSGFSLIELLMVIMIGGLMMSGVATLMISHMQTSARTEAIQRLQDAWNRVQFLLDQEIQESSLPEGETMATNCAPDSLTLKVPIPNTYETTDIRYIRSASNELMRTGPSIGKDGKLDFAGPQTTGIVMTNVKSFVPICDEGYIKFKMKLEDAAGITYENQSDSSGSRPVPRLIDS